MKTTRLSMCVSTLLFATSAWADDWTEVSNLEELYELGECVTAVELSNIRGRESVNLLTELADSRSDITKLRLVARGYGGVGPLDRLLDFTGLVHLEVIDADTNFCYVDKRDGTTEIDTIVQLTGLRTLVFESG